MADDRITADLVIRFIAENSDEVLSRMDEIARAGDEIGGGGLDAPDFSGATDDLKAELLGDVADLQSQAATLKEELGSVGAAGAEAGTVLSGGMALGKAAVAGLVFTVGSALVGALGSFIEKARDAGVVTDTLDGIADSADRAQVALGTVLVRAIEAVGDATGIVDTADAWVGLVEQYAQGNITLGEYTKTSAKAFYTTSTYREEVDKLTDAQGEQESQIGSTNTALDEITEKYKNAGKSAAEMASDINEARVESLGVGIDLAENIEEAQEKLGDLRDTVGELVARRDELTDKGFLTSSEKGELEDINADLEETKSKIADVQAAWQEQTNQFIFNMIEQKAAADGVISDVEFEALGLLAGQMGLVTGLSSEFVHQLGQLNREFQSSGDAEAYAEAVGKLAAGLGEEAGITDPAGPIKETNWDDLEREISGATDPLTDLKDLDLTGTKNAIQTGVTDPIGVALDKVKELQEALGTLNTTAVGGGADAGGAGDDYEDTGGV